MNKKDLASPCGIFCAACPRFYKYGICKGCRADTFHDACEIYDCCVRIGGMEFCFECDLFPCQRLKTFSNYHPGENFAHYRHIVIDNLLKIKEIGVENWYVIMNQKFMQGEYGIQQRNPDGSFDISCCPCCNTTK
ncbi:MAG TPA: DUF3795 domain-containing protein [Spirochaetota bacterium]|nr:DUF3795 domain-containing protein [Spirochaetota bacterium]HOM11339.1 DUF3795 domain-containing protein [Spirochaetota bacterium]HPP51148.1 DUF3795 domain-containing protein [Spirochaetota bacterium]HXK66297.1 DUF3795 domain-containing protein [Spirochaetota bacterium]